MHDDLHAGHARGCAIEVGVEMKCTGKSGTCRWSCWSELKLCIGCAAAAGNEEASASLRERGARGHETRRKLRNARRVTDIQVRTAEDGLLLIDKHLVDVLNGPEAATSKTASIVKLVASALELAGKVDLREENEQLRALLLDRHPQLRDLLGSKNS